MMKLWKSRKPDTNRRKNRKRLGLVEQLEGRRLLAGNMGLPPDMIADPYAFIGDHSGSNSEIWSMQVAGETITAPDYGDIARERLTLEKGKTYEVSVNHVGTNRTTDGEPDPDYDYRAWIDNSANPAWTSGSSTPSGNDFFADNSSGLLQRRFFGDDTNEATGTAKIHVPAVDLDIDSDNSGAIDGSLDEDHLEISNQQGAFVQLLSGDSDNDGVQDTMDFDGIAGASFTPIKVSLSSNLIFAGGTTALKFTFDDAGMGQNGSYRLWRKDASQARSSSDLVLDNTPVDAGALGLTPGGSITLYLEAVNATSRFTNFDPVKVTAIVSGTVWSGSLVDTVHAVGVDFDLDVKTVSQNNPGSELAENKEQTTGAFVPVNNDDDDYDANNLPDFLQSGAIQGENDLLPIVIRDQPRGGDYTLSIPSNLRVWKNANRSDEVTAATTISSGSDTTLYVEGTMEGEGEIALNWSKGSANYQNVDRIKVTAFSLTGPLNVPGNSVYNYTVSGVQGGNWGNVSGGSVQASAAMSADVKWNNTPIVGSVVYAATPDYSWGLDVNVVAINFGTGGTVQYATDTPFQQAGPGGRLIQSSQQTNAMRADFSVTSVVGPTVGGVQRGRKFIEIGVTHQARFMQKHAVATNQGQVIRRVSNLEGPQWYDDLGVAGAAAPWVDGNSNHKLDITSDAQPVNGLAFGTGLFATGDRPQAAATDTYLFGGVVTGFEIIMEHRNFVAVKAKGPNVNGSADVLTQLASWEWTFDGTGSINANQAYTHTGQGVQGTQLQLITDGRRVPSAGPNLPQLLPSPPQTWSTQ